MKLWVRAGRTYDIEAQTPGYLDATRVVHVAPGSNRQRGFVLPLIEEMRVGD